MNKTINSNTNLSVQDLCEQLLTALGENPDREGLARTPARFEKAMNELTVGYNQNIKEIVNGAIFHESYSEMIVVKDIEFYSLCEHHILPFFGHATVAYIPDGKIVGLSKIPRIVNMFARRLQIQERLTDQVTESLDELLSPKGVACVFKASHMCMMMRGIQKQASSMVTSSMRGCFLGNSATRNEFMKIATNTL